MVSFFNFNIKLLADTESQLIRTIFSTSLFAKKNFARRFLHFKSFAYLSTN